MKYHIPVLIVLLIVNPIHLIAQLPLNNQKTDEGLLFQLSFDNIGITSLKLENDKYDTDYIRAGRTLGNIIANYRLKDGEWQQFSTAGIDRRYRYTRISEAEEAPDQSVTYNPSGWDNYYADLEYKNRFKVEGDALYWTIHYRNLTHKPIELGDVILPLPFNSEARWDKTIMATQRVVRHRFVSGHGSFIFWMRPNGEGPYLVMTPVQECPLFESYGIERNFAPASLEYFSGESVYIHSAHSLEKELERGGNWRQPHTSAVLSPKYSPDDELSYAFKFQWADDYEGVRDILVEEGLFDVEVLPGMTIPQDMDAKLSLRTLRDDFTVTPEYPGETTVDFQGKEKDNTHIYNLRFNKLGENKLIIDFGDDQHMILEFFVTEALETLIKKRASFLVSHQQHRDPNKWYNGLFSEWDAMNEILLGPDNTGGMKRYMLSCDDPGLCKAPYIAAKNVHYPVQKEIEAVEYYIEHFLWGGQQCTDTEEYPYGVYGIPDWKVNRESKPTDREGWTGHVWRTFDYPHVINLYLNMYLVAKYYPELTSYLDADGYLERAYGTTMAYFTFPLQLAGWSAYDLGNMDDLVITDLISELEASGKKKKADVIREHWENKIEHFINDQPNRFHSEYPYDPTGYESYQGFASYAMDELASSKTSLNVTYEDTWKFMEDHIAENIAARGWLETAYWQLGSERNLRYMSQMGGWSILDYGLYHAIEPGDYLRLGYASFLSSWCLMNTGTRKTNWGYWFPGQENDGAAGSAFISAPFGGSWVGKDQARGPWVYSAEIDLGFGGALRTAATVVTQDPQFGLSALGGSMTKSGDIIRVVPRDGLRKCFHYVVNDSRFHLLIERDGFAAEKAVEVNQALSAISFTLERRYDKNHETMINISGLPNGSYKVLINDDELTQFSIERISEKEIAIPMKKDLVDVNILRM